MNKISRPERADTASPPSGYVMCNGVNTAYYETGTGDPLLLINGGPGFPAAHFGPLAERLAEHLDMRVIRYDQRGTGQSRLESMSVADLTVEAMADDIDALRQGLRIGEWVVMGHSFGGVLAMMHAVAHPDRVSKLILSAPAGADLSFIPVLGDSINARLTEQQKAELKAIGERSPTPSYQSQLDMLGITLSTYLTDKSNTQYLLDLVVNSRIYEPDVKDLVWKDFVESSFDLTSALSALTMPTCVVQGADDPLGEANARKVSDLIAGSHLVIIADANHYTWIDNPDDYYAALARFLGR